MEELGQMETSHLAAVLVVAASLWFIRLVWRFATADADIGTLYSKPEAGYFHGKVVLITGGLTP